MTRVRVSGLAGCLLNYAGPKLEATKQGVEDALQK